jgi:Mrp family chromosome partitioning ATPase
VSALGRHFADAGRRVLLVDANPNAGGTGRPALATLASAATGSAPPRTDAAEDSGEQDGSIGVLQVHAGALRAQVGAGGPELSFEQMRRILDDARAEHDVVLVDLGVLRAGGQAAVGAALCDRVVTVAAVGESKQRISATLDLLDRLAPARQLLALNRMPAGDPQLASPSAPATDLTPQAWLKNLLNNQNGA